MLRMGTRVFSFFSAAVLLVSPISLLPAHAQQTIPLWPHATPEPAQTTEAEKDVTKDTDALISGHRTARLTNVTQPSMTVYLAPSNRNTGAAAVVFPGGGYQRLAWNGEGTDTCAWVNSLGMTCLLIKYRVPEKGRFPDNPVDLEDAQQAMRIARAHADAWHLDPQRLGIIGFSAGGHLSVLLSTHWDDHHVETTPAAGDVNAAISARPAFAILGYPAYLESADDHKVIDPVLTPVQGTPPTFIIQAENDKSYIDSSLAYYRALKDAHVPAELHLYATGGHGFGMHPVGMPAEHWTQLASQWLRTIGILPTPIDSPSRPGTAGVPGSIACPLPQPVIGRPGDPSKNPTPDPNCW